MLKPWFDNRLLYVIVTTAVSGYFNPTNTEPYADKKRKYATYLEKPIVKEALKTKNTVGIGKQREVVLFFIKHRMYLMLDMMGKIRKWQKEHRQDYIKSVKYYEQKSVEKKYNCYCYGFNVALFINGIKCI